MWMDNVFVVLFQNFNNGKKSVTDEIFLKRVSSWVISCKRELSSGIGIRSLLFDNGFISLYLSAAY